MAEYSRFWDATDPVAEPYIYDDDEFAEAMGRSRWQNGVLLGHDLECRVAPPGGTKTVIVATGEAIIQGYWYQNTAPITIAIPDHAGVSRTDRIILRWTAATKTIAAVRLAGAEGSTAPAALTQTAAVYEIPLAIVYITNVNLTTSDVAEDRIFAQPYSRTYQRNYNLIINGHCFGLETTSPWETSNLAVTSNTGQHSFGPRSFQCISSAINGYLRQIIANEYMYNNRPYYVRAKVYVSSGGPVRMDVTGGIYGDFPREIQTTGTGSWELLEGTFYGTGGADVPIDFIATTHPTTFYVDEVMVLEGGSYELYVPNQIQIYQQKNVFVPCVAARNTTGGSDITRSSAEGWEFADAVDTEGYGNWNLPYDYMNGSTITIDPIYSYPSGHGFQNLVLRNVVYFAYWTECWNTANPALDTGLTVEGPLANDCTLTFGAGMRLTSANIDASDTLFLTFTRDGNHASDDFTASIHFVGWVIYYIARENIT